MFYAIVSIFLRVYCMPEVLSDEGKYCVLMPFILYTSYIVFINTLDHLKLAMLLQSLVISSSLAPFSPLTWGDVWIIIYADFIMILVTVSALGQTLKARQILEEQTLHMSAIHHEIKTPLQVIF